MVAQERILANGGLDRDGFADFPFFAERREFSPGHGVPDKEIDPKRKQRKKDSSCFANMEDKKKKKKPAHRSSSVLIIITT